MINHEKNKKFAKTNLVVSPYDNWKFEIFVEDYLATMIDEIVAEFDFVWENQTEDEVSYGDIDWTTTKIEIDGRKVLFLKDNSTCNPIDKFLIIRDERGIHQEFHIRCVWNDKESDYHDKSAYLIVERPNLQWYKDRNFDLDHDETKYQGLLKHSFGDCRDSGFIFTCIRYVFPETPELNRVDELKQWKIEKGTIYRWAEYKLAIRNLFGCRYDIEQ